VIARGRLVAGLPHALLKKVIRRFACASKAGGCAVAVLAFHYPINVFYITENKNGAVRKNFSIQENIFCIVK
jgi:hypothetical protein